MEQESALFILLAVATGVALAARLIKVPYVIALVIAGIGLGLVPSLKPPKLNGDILYGVILPGLLFEAAFHLELSDLRRNKLAIVGLAVPGVAAVIGLTAWLAASAAPLVELGEHFRMIHGLVLAAILAATDPVAVIGLFKTLGVPRRLRILVEGESLLNDGTGIVFFGLVVGIAAGGQLSPGAAAVAFLRVVGTGALAGLVVGYAISRVIHWIDDPMLEITLTTVAAYAPFLLAEQLHGSGVIATVASGMMCGNYAARTGMSPSTRLAVVSFWEYVAFALNSVVFLLIGLEVHPQLLLAGWRPILMAYAAVLAARAAVIFGSSLLLRPTRERIPPAWSAVLTWGGMRGALSMVLALSLPQDFPERDLILTMTFGVVALSLLVQGLTMNQLLRLLDLARVSSRRLDYERARARLQAARAAHAGLDELIRTGEIDPDVGATLRQEYQRAAEAAEAAVRDQHLEQGVLRDEKLRAARRRLLIVEKDALARGQRAGLYPPEAAEALVADIDARLAGGEEGAPEAQDEEPKREGDG